MLLFFPEDLQNHSGKLEDEGVFMSFNNFNKIDFIKIFFPNLVFVFISACTPSTKKAPIVTNSHPVEHTSATNTEGTVDGGGGGNKICGRPIDAFRIKINDTPEFKKYINPIFQYFASTSSSGCEDCQSHAFAVGAHINYTIFNKGWYLVPCPIEKISKEKIGSVFDTEQVALQTFDDIWIDENKFNSMNEEDRALMIFHEIIMSIKILKSDSALNQCIAFAPSESYCTGLYNRPRKKVIDLNTSDYKDVRIVTNELFKNYKSYDEIIRSSTPENTQKPKSVYSLLRSYNFSNEYNIWSRSSSEKPSVTIKELIHKLRTSQLTSSVPKFSNFKEINKTTYEATSNCEFEFNHDLANDNLLFKFKTYSLENKNIEIQIQKLLKVNTNEKIEGHYNDQYENNQLVEYKSFSLPFGFSNKEDSLLKIGDKTFSLYFTFDGDSLTSYEVTEMVCIDVNKENQCVSFHSMNDSKVSHTCINKQTIHLSRTAE